MSTAVVYVARLEWEATYVACGRTEEEAREALQRGVIMHTTEFVMRVERLSRTQATAKAKTQWEWHAADVHVARRELGAAYVEGPETKIEVGAKEKPSPSDVATFRRITEGFGGLVPLRTLRGHDVDHAVRYLHKGWFEPAMAANGVPALFKVTEEGAAVLSTS